MGKSSLAVETKAAQQQTSLEVQIQATLNVIPAYTWYALPSGALTFVNERTANYLGLPEDHPLRFGIDTGAEWDSHTALLHPDDREEARRVWSTCLSAGTAGELTFRVPSAEGKYRWFLTRAEPLRAGDGTVLYWIGVNLDIDDTKQAEDALRKSEKELRDAIDTIPALVWSALPDGSNTYVNKRFVEYTGSSAEQTARSGWQALVHADDLERHAGKWMEAVATGKPHESEVRSRRADGQYRWQLDRGAPLRDEDGNIVKWYGVTTDIEDRKRAEEALQESQSYLAEGQRLAHMGSWAFNPTGFSYWSSELFRIYGLDPSGKPPTVEEYLALVHPEDRAYMKQGIAKMLDDHLAFDFTKRIVRPDGKIRRIRCVGIPVTQGGAFQGFLGTGMDVTEQERLTEELRLSEHYLSEGQRLAHMGSWVLDPAGCFPYWSHELFLMYGLDPAKEGPSLAEYLALIHPQDREFMTSLIKKIVAEALGCDITKRIVRPNGELRYIRCVGTPVVENGTLQRIVGTAMDVTEHELLTRELRRREAYLAEAQRLSHTGSFGWRPDSGEIVWSEETYRIFGYDHAVKPTIDLLAQGVHPEDRPGFLKVIESASAEATHFEHTYRLLLPDGSVKQVHALAHALQDASGNREFVGAATDVTSIKRAEEELRTSEAYLAEAQRLSQTGSWAWNPVTGDIRYWSEECYRVLGFDPQGPLPRFETFFQRLHADDQGPVRERFEKAIRDKADFEFDYRLVHPDKGVRDIHVVGHAVLDRSGDFGEFVGTVIDITERKRAEQELQQLVDFVPQLIVVFDSDGKVIYANRMAREYTGLTHEEFRSLDVLGRIIHPDDLERAGAVREQGFAGSVPFELDARLLGKDGVHRWFLGRYNPLVEEGRVRRWYVSATEIESRKQEEERVRQENVRLEERTRIAQELHDTLLQNFLSASMQLGATVNGVPSDSPVKGRLDRILQLMEQGIEEGRRALQGLRLSDAHPLNLVQAFSGIQRELAVPSDVEFRVTVIGEERPLHLAIQHEICRIGREALINAFRHSRATRVEVDLEYGDSELRMRVQDNGCGVDPRLFETGCEGHWGLAGMRERAAKIGGLLKIRSNASAGTEVELSIPSSIALELSPANRLSA
jgi:PAS domain S-box-containing protein